MRTQNANLAAASRPTSAPLGVVMNGRQFSESWAKAGAYCPCDGCGQVARCARQEIACRAFRKWVATGMPVAHLERVPGIPVARIFATEEQDADE